MKMSTVQPTSDNRLLAVVMKHGARLARVIGPATIQPHHWPAVNLAMLGAIDDAVAQMETDAAERVELDLIRWWLESNCQDRRLVSAPISDQVMDLITWQQDQLEALSAANKRQEDRIAALLATVKAQDEEIAKCSTKPLPCTPIPVSTVSFAPVATTTSNGAAPMPLPESLPATTGDQDTATSVLPATGSSPTARRYTAAERAALRTEVVSRMRAQMTELKRTTLSKTQFRERNPDLPTPNAMATTLAPWGELIAEASRTLLLETTAATTAAVPFRGANGTGK
jgi:hypothetical protein